MATKSIAKASASPTIDHPVDIVDQSLAAARAMTQVLQGFLAGGEQDTLPLSEGMARAYCWLLERQIMAAQAAFEEHYNKGA